MEPVLTLPDPMLQYTVYSDTSKNRFGMCVDARSLADRLCFIVVEVTQG